MANQPDHVAISQMSWQVRLQNHKQVFFLPHTEATQLNNAHIMATFLALGDAGTKPDVSGLTPDQVSPLKATADTRNNATITNTNAAAASVQAIDTSTGTANDWKAKMEASRKAKEDADNAATDKAYADAEAHISTLPPAVQDKAANVFTTAMSWVSQAYQTVAKALTDAFNKVVDAINKAIQAVEDAAKAAVHWVEGAASSVKNFFEDLF